MAQAAHHTFATDTILAIRTGSGFLWCEHGRTETDGTVKFTVVNGGWRGSYKDGAVQVHDTRTSVPAKLVWCGVAPADDDEYQDVILWVEDKLCFAAHDAGTQAQAHGGH